MDGILPLWKPKGFTSHDCVSKARGMLKTKKIGHTGTLDPQVEGVLPLCVGKATKIVPFLTDTTKVYEATVRIGYSTATEDSEGEIIERKAVSPSLSLEKIKEELPSFQGDIIQIPPMYSAVKVKGKKLYEYAREGIEVERPKRQVRIEQIDVTSRDLEFEEETASFSIRVVCSKGTYIRTLCADLGRALGYPSHMSSLVRTQTADISEQECYRFEEIQRKVDEHNHHELLLPIKRGLSHMPSWKVTEDMKTLIQHGRVLDKPEHLDANTFLVLYEEEALAIYQQHPTKAGYVKPLRVF
ncbi:tRNA pseudouridine(55) synthase TruB [Halobacillus halophilus]|uniref:tRNA pseudouridine(55) synthase TruB n=1 Tax=Halobacillus halophilus TaxID=1570 RepID=UPI001CD448C3|nr:tRNA pseudouridine(55) synthase TruB [Halobacillus halophilus]MCA1009277.1 tRNA pseudouridine(55) synthase TruB [Halobacillus halophilus]